MTARFFEGAAHAAIYAKFRPVVPLPLISSVFSFLQEKIEGPFQSAVDVGCGSGQSTNALARNFLNVKGYDVSEAQIKEAINQNTSKNVTFKVSPAEELAIENESVQLVTTGQACHWFDIPKFYEEVNRILVPNGVIAVYGYNFPRPIFKDKSEQLFNLLNTIYEKDTKNLWGKERVFVDNAYTDKVFTIPYSEHKRDDTFVYEKKGSIRDVEGYISSWSGLQKYKEINGEEAARHLLENFVHSAMNIIGSKTSLEETEITLRFPFFLLMGRKPSS